MLIKSVFTLLLLCCSCVWPGNVWAKGQGEELRSTTLHYPPYAYELNGVPTGVAIDVLREVVRRTSLGGVSVRFYPWKRAVHLVQHGERDVLFNAGKNKARQEWGRYSDHVLILQKYYLFARKGSGIQTDLRFDNLQSRKIAVRAGYLYGSGAFKKAIVEPSVFKEVLRSNSTEQSVRLLLGKRVDMFVGDYLPVMHYLVNNDLADKVELVQEAETQKGLVVLSWPTYFLFSKSNVSLERFTEFEDALEGMFLDGTYEALFDKYNMKYQLKE